MPAQTIIHDSNNSQDQSFKTIDFRYFAISQNSNSFLGRELLQYINEENNFA